MKGASKVIMGATLVMVVTLAIVLGLILVLLAELYCSLLLRRRQHKKSPSSDATVTAGATAASSTPISPTSSLPPPRDHQSTTSPLSSIYAQGVLHAPRDYLLFPSPLLPTATKQSKTFEEQNHHSTLLHQVVEVHSQESNTISSPFPTSPLSTSFASSPQQQQHVEDISIQVSPANNASKRENFVYISNPIYDNNGGAGRPSMPDTPFETPDTSPSRLESSGSSGDDDEIGHEKAEPPGPVRVMLYSPPLTPPLSPMKKLPAQACSVSLRDARSLGTNSGSDESNSNNDCLSSSSSGSPCTSPSW